MSRIYIDTETTGLNKHQDHVVEVAAVATNDNGEVLDTYQSLACPPLEVLESPKIDVALDINKITREELRAAPPAQQVADALRSWLARWQSTPDFDAPTLHAFNVEFDAAFLAREPWNVPRDGWGECVMLAVANGKRWCKLGVAAITFGLEWDGSAHRALADALMAAKVHQHILTRRAM